MTWFKHSLALLLNLNSSFHSWTQLTFQVSSSESSHMNFVKRVLTDPNDPRNLYNHIYSFDNSRRNPRWVEIENIQHSKCSWLLYMDCSSNLVQMLDLHFSPSTTLSVTPLTSHTMATNITMRRWKMKRVIHLVCFLVQLIKICWNILRLRSELKTDS